MITPLTCGWGPQSIWGMVCSRWIYVRHMNNPWRQIFHLMFVWFEQFWVMQKLHKFDLLSKASDDANLGFCPFCCNITILCLYNVTHVHTWFGSRVLICYCRNSNWSQLAFVAPICKANICLFIEKEEAILQSPISAWSHPIPHTQKQR